MGLHDEENDVRMHVLQATTARVIDVDPSSLVHETETVDRHRLIGNVLLRARHSSARQAKNKSLALDRERDVTLICHS